MMKRVFIIFFTLLCALQGENAFSQVQSTRGPLYLTTAWNPQVGDVTIHFHSRFYHNSKSFYQGSHYVNGVSFWDIQGGFQVNYSLRKHILIGLSQILYQDNHKEGAGYNLPDDMTLHVKAGDFSWKNKDFRFGGKFSLRIPTAKYHNVILEPYASGKWTLGVFALASYSKSQNFPDLSPNFHANLGLIDHNDHGVYWYDDNTSKILHKHNTRELVAAVAAVYPLTNFDFSAELFGNYFITKPPATVFSRHSYLYFSPAVTYNPLYWLSFSVGMDLRLSPNRSSASPAIDSDLPAYLPTYPTWRVNFKLNINLSSRLQNRFVQKKEEEKKQTVVVTADTTKQQPQTQVDVYQQIANEKKHIEKAELELMQLIERRKQMDEILARLKRALAEEEKKKKK